MNREQWLTENANLIADDLAELFNLPRPKIRVGCSIPYGYRNNKKVLGQCWTTAQSSDQTNEIFISPTIDDGLTALAILTHELIHAFDDCQSGHKGAFKRIALQYGFLPPLTKLDPSNLSASLKPELLEGLQALADEQPYPHASLDLTQPMKKKQTTRNIKIECGSCGWSFRTSNKNVDLMTSNQCLSCGEHNLATPMLGS